MVSFRGNTETLFSPIKMPGKLSSKFQGFATSLSNGAKVSYLNLFPLNLFILREAVSAAIAWALGASYLSSCTSPSDCIGDFFSSLDIPQYAFVGYLEFCSRCQLDSSAPLAIPIKSS